MQFSLTRVSRNRKTGPIPVATSSVDTCPDDCALMGAGCYAESGPLRLHWLNNLKLSFPEFLRAIRALPKRQLWRYGQAGDLPPRREDVLALAQANARRPVICYTHRCDVATYHDAAKLGFVINLSANSLTEADALMQHGLPIVAILPSRYHRGPNETLSEFRGRLGGTLALTTPAGAPVALCPATYTDVTCSECQVCARPRPRGTVIGFPAHGTRRRLLDVLTSGVSSYATQNDSGDDEDARARKPSGG